MKNWKFPTELCLGTGKY